MVYSFSSWAHTLRKTGSYFYEYLWKKYGSEESLPWIRVISFMLFMFLRIIWKPSEGVSWCYKKAEFQLCQKASLKLGKTTCPRWTIPWNQRSILISKPDKKESKEKPTPRRVPCLSLSVQQSHVVWNRGHYSVDQGRVILGCIYLCNSAVSSSVSPSCPFHFKSVCVPKQAPVRF